MSFFKSFFLKKIYLKFATISVIWIRLLLVSRHEGTAVGIRLALMHIVFTKGIFLLLSWNEF